MTDCLPDTTETYCIHCGWKKPERIKGWPRRNCPKSPDAPPRAKGPGDFLHDAILKWAGEGPTRECGCKDRIAKMNAWGPAGCREHLEEIVEWLTEEAKKRNWGKLLTRIPGNDYVIRWMVNGAIWAAEKEATSTQSSDS